MDIYRADSLRFPQEFFQESAVAGTTITTSAWVVPANTIRTILMMSYGCDIAENRWITFKVQTPTGASYTFRGPVSFDGNNGNPFGVLEQGNEIHLLPGDYMRIDRSAATAGSKCYIYVRYIDHILPFQKHVDPYDTARRRSPFLSAPSVGGGGAGGGGGTEGGIDTGYVGPGGGGEPLL